MERALYSWTAENKERLKMASLKVALIDDKGVEFDYQGSRKFQLSVPAAIFTTGDDDEDDDDFDFFLAYSIGKQNENRKEFEDKIKALNEKVQNVKISLGRKALEAVMDHLIATFADVKKAETSDLDINLDKILQKSGAGSSANKGLLRTVLTEFKNVSRCNLPGVSVEIPDETDICKWHVKMDKDLFKGSKDLYGDLQNYASRVRVCSNEKGNFSDILLEVSFPNDYPFCPPFVRVLSPKFRFHTGHVTLGGAICTEMLTRSGWLPSLSMETVIVAIQYVILEGEGRLEMEGSASDANGEYTLEEAREAFKRFAQLHGWTT